MEAAPRDWYVPLILPVIAIVFGLFIRIAAWSRFRQGANPKVLALVAFVPLILGVVVGGQTVYNMFDPEYGSLYMRTIDGRKSLIAHWAALGLPILTIVGFVIWGQIEKRLGRPISLG